MNVRSILRVSRNQEHYVLDVLGQVFLSCSYLHQLHKCGFCCELRASILRITSQHFLGDQKHKTILNKSLVILLVFANLEDCIGDEE